MTHAGGHSFSKPNCEEKREKMTQLLKISAVAMVALVLATGTALAQNGNPCPGSKEYQFNIIGVPKGKTADMKGNNGHRVFVWLKGKSTIHMTGDTIPGGDLDCGNSFYFTDSNATDGDGATLVVPCDPLTETNLNPSVCYDVWITPLATPGGTADVDVVCSFDATCIGCNIDDGDCASGNIDFDLERKSGKPVQKDITKFFRASGCIDLDANGCDPGDISFNNEWIFNIEQLLSYYWDYTNNYLRLAQVRFCDVEGVVGSDCGPNNLN